MLQVVENGNLNNFPFTFTFTFTFAPASNKVVLESREYPRGKCMYQAIAILT